MEEQPLVERWWRRKGVKVIEQEKRKGGDAGEKDKDRVKVRGERKWGDGKGPDKSAQRNAT